jgi:hypothetical protein
MGNGAWSNSGTDIMLYNLNSRGSTDLSQLFFSAESSGNWPIAYTYSNFSPIALDNNGRIVLSAISFNANIGESETNLLLTPDDRSSLPLEVPAPEPGTLAVMVLAIAGFAARRVRDRRSHPLRTPQE